MQSNVFIKIDVQKLPLEVLCTRKKAKNHFGNKMYFMCVYKITSHNPLQKHVHCRKDIFKDTALFI